MKKLLVTAINLMLLLFLPTAALVIEKPKIGFCVRSSYGSLVLYKRYQPLMDYLTRHTPFQFELIISRNNREAFRMLREGRAQLAFVDDLIFRDDQEIYNVVPLLKPVNSSGLPFVKSTIVVTKKSSIQNISNLRGKTIAFGPHNSMQRTLIPQNLLRRNGVRPSDLQSFKNLRTDEEIVKSVLTGTSDAGVLVDVVAERYMPLGLRILASTEPIPTTPILIRKEASKELARTVTLALANLNNGKSLDERLMQQLDVRFRYGFAPTKVADYQHDIRALRAAVQGCSKNCH